MSTGDMWFHSDYIELLHFLTCDVIWWFLVSQFLSFKQFPPMVFLAFRRFERQLFLQSDWFSRLFLPTSPHNYLIPNPKVTLVSHFCCWEVSPLGDIIRIIKTTIIHRLWLALYWQVLLVSIFWVDSNAASLFENSCLSWQIILDDKIQITLLILALSNFGVWWWSWSTLCSLLWFVLGGSLSRWQTVPQKTIPPTHHDSTSEVEVLLIILQCNLVL